MASTSEETSITAGVKYDFECLLKSFTELNTVRYVEFASVWRRHKMTLLCAGRLTDADTREFMTEVFKIAVQFNMPAYTDQTRIGAIYLLYSLYYTQPCKQKVLIRMTCTQWKEMVRFQDCMARQGHHDAVYVFLKLYGEGAFLFVALKNEVIKGGNTDLEQPLGDSDLRDDLQISKIFDEESLKQLSSLHTQYTRAKTLLAGPGASQPERSLSMTHSQLVPDIVKTMDALYNKIKTSGANGQEKQGRKLGPPRVEMLSINSQAEMHKKSLPRTRKRRAVFQKDSDEEEEEAEEGAEEEAEAAAEPPLNPHFIMSMPTLDSSDDNADDSDDKDDNWEPPAKAKKGGRGRGGGRGGGKRSDKGKGRGKGRGKSKASKT